MHFLKKIIQNPTLKDPAKEHMDVHRHFYRFSRGLFIGPAIEIRKTSAKLSFKGSLEYEDIIQELIVKKFSKNERFIIPLVSNILEIIILVTKRWTKFWSKKR